MERLEVGVAESGVMLALAGHFDQLEADRSLARLEMRKMQVITNWRFLVLTIDTGNETDAGY